MSEKSLSNANFREGMLLNQELFPEGHRFWTIFSVAFKVSMQQSKEIRVAMKYSDNISDMKQLRSRFRGGGNPREKGCQCNHRIWLRYAQNYDVQFLNIDASCYDSDNLFIIYLFQSRLGLVYAESTRQSTIHRVLIKAYLLTVVDLCNALHVLGN